MLNPLERAYEMARSGSYPDVKAILIQLKVERFEDVEAHFSGKGLRDELRGLIREAGGSSLAAAREKRRRRSRAEAANRGT